AMSLRVVVADPWGVRRRWIDALAASLPDAQVCAVGDGNDTNADYAIGWNPDRAFFARHRSLRAFFASSAGVDALLRGGALPESLPLVRIEDGGMATQMADYCVYEALRLQRRFGEYEAQQREQLWRTLEAEPKSAWPVGILG